MDETRDSVAHPPALPGPLRRALVEALTRCVLRELRAQASSSPNKPASDRGELVDAAEQRTT